MISFGRHICNDFSIAVEKEWILSNEKGSFASSTILLANTRKYHGILTAKLPGIDNRIVLFPNCDEEVEIAGHIHQIATHKYKDTVFPRGFAFMENFHIRDERAVFIYLIDNIRLKKEIFIMKDANTVVIKYTQLTPNGHIKLTIRPFIAFREAEHLIREMPAFDPEIIDEGGRIKISAFANMPSAYIYNPDNGSVLQDGVWYRDFYYIREGHAGFDASEDLYNPFKIVHELDYNETKSIVFSSDSMEPGEVAGLENRFNTQIQKMKKICVDIGACVRDDDYRVNIRHLVAAAGSFVAKDSAGMPAVVAGFPWPHYIWMRDTFASFPGLFLVLKKYEEAKELLLNTVELEKNGLIPLSMTMERNDIRYTSVDSTLWYFQALYKYLEYTGDYSITAAGAGYFEKLVHIMSKLKNGTDFNIHCAEDGLLYAGFPGLQLTWMDSSISGAPVTPRQGMAVEINALWYNAVRTMENISAKNGSAGLEKQYRELADRIHASFNSEFWYEEGGYLYDYIDSGYKDITVRPNMITAISLPFELIGEAHKKAKIMNVIIKELYTSFGLRTLSNMNVNFKASYGGDKASQDKAAHQGTVWSWTVGHFVTAYIKTYGRGEDSLKFIETVYEPFFEHLKTAGLGTVSEMFDGSFPYNAKGRISHAWAVAELLRSYFEDFLAANGKT